MFNLNIQTIKKFCRTHRLATIKTTLTGLFPQSVLKNLVLGRNQTQFLNSSSNLLIGLLPRTDILCSRLTPSLAQFQFPSHFNPNLINSAILVNDSIDDIDHLIQNLFNHRLTKFILLQLRQFRQQFPGLILRLGDAVRMINSDSITSLAIFGPVHQRRKNLPHELERTTGISLFDKVNLAKRFQH